MNDYKNAAIGLKKMYKAYINMLIALGVTLVLCWIPMLPYICLIAIFVFGVQGLIGWYSVGKDIPLCKTAFILMIGSIVVGLILSFIPALSLLGTICGFISLVTQLMMIWSVTKVMQEKGVSEAEKWGNLAFWFCVGDVALTVLTAGLSLIAVLSVGLLSISLILSIVSIGIGISFLVFLLKFLKSSAIALGAYF